MPVRYHVEQCVNSTIKVPTISARFFLMTRRTPRTTLVPYTTAFRTTTNNTGAATASDGCGTVAITYSDSVSNACGGTKVISRTWTASDQCGNTTNRVQTITVRDTTPPIVTPHASVVLECPSDTTSNNASILLLRSRPFPPVFF